MAEPIPASPHLTTPAQVLAEWVTIDPTGPAEVPLRCWWARPADRPARAGVLVLPEVFGLNGWVRSVAQRLAAEGYATLAVPLFARTAPALDLGYEEAALLEGRSHKERTSVPQLLADVALAADWLLQQNLSGGLPAGGGELGCVGFCFGGHVALLAATLPQIAASCAFYGAGVATGRPGGGAPSLELLPQIPGRLLCVYGSEDPLIPPREVDALAAALDAANALRRGATSSGAAAAAPGPHRLLLLEGGHGFMCEARSDHRPAAAALGWRAMLGWFDEHLGAQGGRDR